MFRIAALLIALTGLSFILQPIALYYLTGNVEMILPTHIPFADSNTTSGYWITAAFHILMLCYGVIGTIGSDLTLILFVIHAQPLSELFQNAVTELNKLVHQKNMSKALIHFMVRNIIMMNQENNKYENLIPT